MPFSFRRRSLVLAALALSPLIACGGTDPFAPVASLYTGPDVFVLYPLSTAPNVLPSGLQMITRSAVRPQVSSSLGINFDFVVDLDAQNRVRILPPKLIATLPTGTPVTGIQIVAATYDSLLRAPNTGYVLRLGHGRPARSGLRRAGAGCDLDDGGVFPRHRPSTARMIIDSVVAVPALATSRIYLRSVIDPNCGFRSLESGVLPKS